MPRSVRKGPFVDNHLAKKVAEAAKKNDRRPDQDLVASFDDICRTWSV